MTQRTFNDILNDIHKNLFNYMIKPHDGLFPTKIIHSGPATIVFWNDKTKTVVKLSDDDFYDEYAAFCAALAKKIYGTNSHLKTIMRKAWVEK